MKLINKKFSTFSMFILIGCIFLFLTENAYSKKFACVNLHWTKECGTALFTGQSGGIRWTDTDGNVAFEACQKIGGFPVSAEEEKSLEQSGIFSKAGCKYGYTPPEPKPLTPLTPGLTPFNCQVNGKMVKNSQKRNDGKCQCTKEEPYFCGLVCCGHKEACCPDPKLCDMSQCQVVTP